MAQGVNSYVPNPYECQVAWFVAGLRGRDNRLQSNVGGDADRAAMRVTDYQAILAEISVSRLMNLCWTGLGFREPDVGGVWEVRSTDDPTYGLMARETDSDETPCVLVDCDRPSRRFTMVGWEFARTVREKGFPLTPFPGGKQAWVLPRLAIPPERMFA